MKWIEQHPEQAEVIDEELASIDSALTDKVNSEIQDAVSEEITIQDY